MRITELIMNYVNQEKAVPQTDRDIYRAIYNDASLSMDAREEAGRALR